MSHFNSPHTIKPFWQPLTAGVALGLVLLLTFLLTGHGLEPRARQREPQLGWGLDWPKQPPKAMPTWGPW
jgi:hypothetical protein